MTEDDKGETISHKREASTSFLNAVSNTRDLIGHSIHAIWNGLDERPILRFVLLALFSSGVAKIVGWTAGAMHSFFFTRPLTMQGSVMLSTFPLPVGLSLWILTVLWIWTVLWAILRISELRRQVEAIQQ